MRIPVSLRNRDSDTIVQRNKGRLIMFHNQITILVIDIILAVTAIGLMIPVAVLFIECMAALLPSRTAVGNNEVQVTKPRVAVLVPAHNEASGISATIETLLPQLTDRDRLVVIADNCTDETAAIASKLGATVIERQDCDRKGKGYALDYGLRFLEDDPPDVVTIVDADCIVCEDTIKKISALAAAAKLPVQSLYLMEKPAHPTPKDGVSALAFTVKNLVRLRGLTQLRLPCLLTGTGMAFPWFVICQAPLASGNIVEDMQLGIDLAIAGYAPIFCEEAKVLGRLPQQQQAAKKQRTRWEHGHLQTSLTQVPRLLKASIIQRRFDLLVMAVDFLVPPLSLLVGIWGVMLGGALLTLAWSGAWVGAVWLGIEGFFLLVAIMAAWAKFGRGDLPLLTLLTVPFYILWKIPLYLGFLVQPQTKWIRTKRDVVDASES